MATRLFRPLFTTNNTPKTLAYLRLANHSCKMLRQYELVERVKAYDPEADEAAINRAYVFSMQKHGTQKRASGDPYYSHCVETMRLLRGQLRYGDDKLMLTFQSRFGRAKWLEPATDKTVKALAKKGVKNLVVITPGFSADCLETLEEIAVENAHIFKRNGGENFAAIPCLNDSAPGMLVIWQMALRELKGWI